jgi:hypothetical protein
MGTKSQPTAGPPPRELLVLAVTARREPLHASQWIVIAVYLIYLLPYVVVSYFERYAIPLLGVEVLLVLWAGERLPPFRDLKEDNSSICLSEPPA